MVSIPENLEIERPRMEPSLSHHAPAIFVWSWWVVMVLGSVYFVHSYGSNFPIYDDWRMVPVLTKFEPVTLEWLFRNENDHRCPLPKLLLLGFARVSGNDFRTGMYVNVLGMSFLAFLLILAAKRVRGSVDYPDAFLPLICLSWGHYANFVWQWQILFISSTVITGIILVLIAFQGKALTARAGLLIGFFLFLLPFCGPSGAALVPALGTWFCYKGIRQFNVQEPRKNLKEFLFLGIGVIANLIVVCLFFGWNKLPDKQRYTLDLYLVSKTALKVMSQNFGSPPAKFWPYSGYAVIILFLMAFFVILSLWKKREEHACLMGFCFFMAGMGCLALGMGWGRGGVSPEMGFRAHYKVLSVPLFCCIYLVFALQNGLLARLGQMALFTSLCLLLPLNIQEGIANAQGTKNRVAEFNQALLLGTPSSELARRYADIGRGLGENLPMLHAAGIGIFGQMKMDPKWPQAPNLKSSIEVADRNQISGWVCDLNQPSQSLDVSIYDGVTFLGTVSANIYRSDLRDAGLGTGNCAFLFPIPLALKDGKSHDIYLKLQKLGINLSPTPLSILFGSKDRP